MPTITSRQIRESGVDRPRIRSALANGTLLRVRRGWYATPDTPEEVLTAIRCGGSLSCAAALRAHGVWVMTREVHVRVDPDARIHARGARIHRLAGTSTDGIDDVISALIVASTCLSPAASLCSLDSALHLGLMTMSTARARLDSPRGRRLLSLADPRSESGLETLMRLRLRSLRVRTRIQVPIAPIGRVDFLVGDRLVIEVDGDQWHSTAEQRESDRRRDSALTARGYLVLRVGYRRIMDDADGFDSEVLAIVRRDEHLWRRIHVPGAR